jgi:CheY-like chemotaxis protein
MSTHATPRAPLSPQVQQDAFRDLCAAYDSFLGPHAESMPEHARLELITYARVFDLSVDDDAPGRDVWRQVRPVLAGHVESERGGDMREAPAPEGRVFLPVSTAMAGDQALDDEPEPLALLLVEDDPDLSAAMMEALTEAGHMVVAAAATAEDAAALAAHHAIDFAIVDVELAGPADGVELARRLHDRWGLQVLFVSGGANEHLVSLPMALGFVGKPFSSAELLAAVTLGAGLLRRRQA